MRRIAFLLAAFVLAAGCREPTQPDNTTASFDSDDNGAVVHVAAPTGDPAADVANIQAAVAAATPGATIQFARGTYTLEANTQINVSVPRVTLQGHRRGTTIVGFFDPTFSTIHFVLNGGAQTVRGLTFQGFPLALLFEDPGTGGYRLEDCTFRNGDLPFFFSGSSDHVSRVRGNKFINVTLPFIIIGKTVHFRGNRITSPVLEDHPLGRPFNAGFLAPDGVTCENNVLEENTVVGNADGFILVDCSNTVIRRNTFLGQRLFPGDADFPSFDDGSMVVGIGPGFQGNLIEKNELRGSPGIGVIVEEGSDNRIVENEFRNLVPGELAPFHATLFGADLAGTGILLGEPTTGNRVLKNKFKNVVNTIVDCGTGNIIGRGQDADDDDCPAPLAVTAERSRTLDHPKLQVLRDRMK